MTEKECYADPDQVSLFNVAQMIIQLALLEHATATEEAGGEEVDER